MFYDCVVFWGHRLDVLWKSSGARLHYSPGGISTSLVHDYIRLRELLRLQEAEGPVNGNVCGFENPFP